MKRLARFVCLSALGLAALLASPVPAWADVNSGIKTVLADKLFKKAAIGVEVLRLGDSPGDARIVFGFNARVPRIPASNLKLVTTAAALDEFGADFKFRTVLLLYDGDLVIIGDGDPTLGDVEMLRKVGWGVDTVFQTWAGRLKARGVKEVRDVVVDDSVFDEQFMHPRWPDDQKHKRYVAGVGGLNLNANCVDFRVQSTGPGRVVNYTMEPDTRYVTVRNTCVGGNDNAVWLSRALGGNGIILKGVARGSTQAPVSVTIHDPSLFAATVFAETLESGGVKVSGVVRRDRTLRLRAENAGSRAGAPGSKWSVVGIHETPLSAVLARTNKDSMNLYAESLCKRLGFAATGQSGSWENGTAAAGEYLKRIGVNAEEFNLDDGCGLSKQNAISPHAVNRVLLHRYHGKDREAFVSSLAVAGVDGTLDDRFRGSDLKGRVFAKSGFVNNVRSLSGYLKAKDGHYYAFSILMNKVPDDPTVKLLQEKIVKAVDAHAEAAVAAGE